MAALPVPTDHAARYLARAAVTAPSPCNTQPWHFGYGSEGLCLFADPARCLPLADPGGREMLISCGAALLNIRLAMRHLGFLPRIEAFPDSADPWHLATVGWGPYAAPTADEETMFSALHRRHTHRGAFQPDPLSALLVGGLRWHARQEGTELRTVGDPEALRSLAALTRASEATRRGHPALAAELANWTPPHGSGRHDGVPAHAYPRDPDTTAFAGRDYAGRARMGYAARASSRLTLPTLGLVVLLCTRHDRPPDWLRTGQALQRVLLLAAAHRVTAAFHTQPLELPDLRHRVGRSVLTAGHPQMLLRLGYGDRARRTPRRPVGDVLSHEPPGPRYPAVPAPSR
ncbi:Acg family FMN-binding oxidoreductase [Streptomyces sp. NPDC057280]|uniref:Acg family FMN-binding oxidoreductase n=1 Tax=Streptomyces sp. NPDC057280 TaxID=3346081 RepID=UPI00362B94E8